jgi:hypothetical protein
MTPVIWAGLQVLAVTSIQAFDGDLTFSGNLQRVGNHSISVKLRDRRAIDAVLPDSGNLTPSRLAGQYTMGDEIEVVCRQIQPLWEQDTSRMQSLEVVSIRFLRKPPPEQLANLFEARAREGVNYLKVPELPASSQVPAITPNGPGRERLEHARKINLDDLAHMPNFIADENAKRYRSGSHSQPLRPYDTVESEIAFKDRRAVRTQIKRDGETWNQPFDALPGYKWYEGFETEIGPLFDPDCPTQIEYRGAATTNGRKSSEYVFRSPVDGCFPFLYFAYQRYNPARTGRFSIEDPAGKILQVHDRSEKFPPDFEFQAREEHFTWDYVKIGESSHLLPVHAQFTVTYRDGVRYRVDVDYRNHRHFEANSNLTFQ